MSSTAAVDFACSNVALVRAAALPLPSADSPTRQQPPPLDVLQDERWWHAQVSELAADSRLMTAVSLASSSLAVDVDRVIAGEMLKPKSIRRIAISLAKYRSRMMHRPTPFGLFAGVGLAGFGTVPVMEPVGEGHSVTRPDAAWLDGVLEQLLEVPTVLKNCRLTANNLRTTRNGRLLLIDNHDPSGSRQLVSSVRCTRVTTHILQAAARPIAWPLLVQEVQRAFPHAPHASVERSILQLVHGRFLLSDLTPPVDGVAPLDYVIDQLYGVDDPTADTLREVRSALAALDAQPPGSRRARITAVTHQMRALRAAPDVLQTDLALGMRLVLPDTVAREAERAATVLWRTSPVVKGSPHLRDYHSAFLDKYGTERLVPVLELLDAARGLGLPGGCLRPSAPRPAAPTSEASERDRVLGELLFDAAHCGEREIALEEATVHALESAERGPAPLSMELGAELVVPDWEALRNGDFHLVLGGSGVTPLAGATFSRFAHVLGESASRVQDLATRVEHAVSDIEIHACVAYRPKVMRSANVSAVPQWLSHRIPLGVGPAASEAVTDLHLENLAVCADTDSLRLVDVTSGRRVRPLSYSMLNPSSGHLPYVARFLLELGQEGQDFCTPWHWGRWESAPALPRVRYGRTVLSAARWLPDRALLAAVNQKDQEWTGQVTRWRRRWDVPRQVMLTKADHRIAVDLDDPLDVMVFRDEVKRNAELRVVEQFGGQEGRRWFRGLDGCHAAEFVFPVFGGSARQVSPDVRRPHTDVPPSPSLPPHSSVFDVTRESTHVPGGEWFYTKIYVPENLHRDVLAHHLSALTDPGLLRKAGADRWFFVRYDDEGPHIRLRFHGKQERLWPVLLPEFHSWAQAGRDAGLIAKVVLDTYEPEVGRYGGAASMPHAENVFHADSIHAVELLASAPGQPDEVVSLATLGILDIFTRLGSPADALSWLSTTSVMQRRGEVPQSRKKSVAQALDTHGRPGPPAPRCGADEAWSARGSALSDLREALLSNGTGPDGLRRIALSLAHMHCNRLLGIRPEQELEAHVTAREGLASWLGRHHRSSR